MLPTTPAWIDGTGHHPRHVSVHGARADRRTRGGCTDRHLRVRRAALRDADRTHRVRRQDAAALLGAILKDDAAACVVAGARHAAGARSRHQHLSREGSGRSLSVGARSPPRSRLGGLARSLRSQASSRPHRPAAGGARTRWLLAAVAMAGFAGGSIVAIRHRRETTLLPVGRVRDSGSRSARVCRRPGGGTGAATQLAVSPDGQHVAFVTRKMGGFQLWLRSVGSVYGQAAAGHGRRRISVLVAGQPHGRVLRGRQAEEDADRTQRRRSRSVTPRVGEEAPGVRTARRFSSRLPASVL